MTKAWLELLKQVGFEVPPHELTLCSTVAGHDTFEIDGTRVARTQPEVGFKALGSPSLSITTQASKPKTWLPEPGWPLAEIVHYLRAHISRLLNALGSSSWSFSMPFGVLDP